MEINVPEELTSGGKYSPRFIGDDIDSEIDIIEDKHAPVFSESRSSKCKLTRLTPENFLFLTSLVSSCSQEKVEEIIHPSPFGIENIQIEAPSFLAFHFGIGWTQKDLKYWCYRPSWIIRLLQTVSSK